MPLTTGQVVSNRYRIIRLLGQGGFGAVYQVWDANLDRQCALKENLETSGEVSRQFEREARLLANLSHPNLPRVTDHFVVPNQGQYLVMDFIEGDDLEERLVKNGGPLELTLVLDWIDQVSDALTYLHRRDPPIIHRDIKPANIRITPQGRAVLVDFGIAKLFNPSLRTTVGARAVTPGYSPPEQYGRGQTDGRSDLYALGATLYTMLTATAPPDSIDLITGAAISPRPAHSINPAVPPAISQAIGRAMNLTREARFESVDAFRQALRSAVPSPSPIVQPAAGLKTAATGVPATISVPQDVPANRPPSKPPLLPVHPASRPKTSRARRMSTRTLAFMAIAGLAVAFVGLAAAISVLSLLRAGTPTPGVSQSVTEISGSVALTAAVDTASPTTPPTETPAPTETLRPPTPNGAILAMLPDAEIAFVSDHGSDGSDQVFVRHIVGGEYLFLPLGDGFFDTLPEEEGLVGRTVAVPMGAGHNMAWWPDWCASNRVILYEAQDTNRPNFQTIYQAAFGAESAGPAQEINWPGIQKIGVPRCANHSSRGIASGLEDSKTNQWRLYTFTVDNPGVPTIIGDGFPFSGFATFAGDDSWFAFMHSEGGRPFSLYWMGWDSPGRFHPMPVPEGLSGARFPALSPAANLLAYACQSETGWGLCMQNPDGTEFVILRSNLAPIESNRRGAKPPVSAITPSWSPDGGWLAYSSNKDGDFDIYIFNVDLKVEYNLTQDLGGEQFQPAWSKP